MDNFRNFKKKKLKKFWLLVLPIKNLDDTREAPSIEFMNIKKKIQIDYHDPNVRYLKSRKLNKIYNWKSCPNVKNMIVWLL